MKKIFTILLTLAIFSSCCAVAFADGRTAPEDSKVITTTDVVGVETMFRKYDAKFYDAPSEQPGTVVRLDYTTDVYGETLHQWANIYLPYGYDENGTEQYNIIYFLHGTNETQDSFIGEEKAKNALDNMIEVGITDPFIMVFPTYYYDYENRAIDMENFVLEVRNDLMPAVESTYRTFATSADNEGFISSRDHRAFCGYSRGSYATWHMFFHNLDYARWYMPFSAAISGAAEMTLECPPEEEIAMLKDAIEAQAEYKNDFYIYMACGGKRDMMYDIVNAQVAAMVAVPDLFSYGLDTAENNLYYSLSNELHQTLMSRFYLYNAFDVVLK